MTWAVTNLARLIVALTLALVLTFGMAIIAAGGYGELRSTPSTTLTTSTPPATSSSSRRCS
jgi:hypothetical protein